MSGEEAGGRRIRNTTRVRIARDERSNDQNLWMVLGGVT